MDDWIQLTTMTVKHSLRLIQLLPLISTFSTPSLSLSSFGHSSDCPSKPPNVAVARNMSGTLQPTEEARAKMMELLDNNHCEFDINYDQFFANHLPHALCSLYSLGASVTRLQEYNKWYVERLVPLRELKFTVTDEDWTSYIGNKYAYAELLDFFDKKVTAHGLQKSLDTYLPRLIPGMIGAALHPLIHIGYAVEYELPRVLAEGLAYACTGYHSGGEVIDSLPEPEPESEPVPSSNSSTVTVLGLLNQVRSLQITEQFRKAGISDDLHTILAKYGTQIKGLLASWDVSPCESKLNELTRATMLAFFGSYRHQSLGFFMAHTLTGNHAVRVLLPHLKDDAQKARLLRMNLLALLGVYTIEGRPEFSEEIIQKYATASGNNVDWAEIIARTIDCEDEHEIKVVRSLLVIKESVPDEVIPHKLLDQCAYLMVNTIQYEKEWIFDGVGYLSHVKDDKE